MPIQDRFPVRWFVGVVAAVPGNGVVPCSSVASFKRRRRVDLIAARKSKSHGLQKHLQGSGSQPRLAPGRVRRDWPNFEAPDPAARRYVSSWAGLVVWAFQGSVLRLPLLEA